MPVVTQQEILEFQELKETATTYPDRITEWEADFLSSVGERIENYGTTTLLSDKQKSVLESISKKVYTLS